MPACELSKKTCVPCRGGVPPLKGDELLSLANELSAEWSVVNEHHLAKAFSFAEWASAMAFANAVSTIAEEQNHHPDLHVSWGRVGVEIWTHKINGLTESDFVFAAKVQEAAERMQNHAV